MPQRAQLAKDVSGAAERGTIEVWCNMQITGVDHAGESARVYGRGMTGAKVHRLVAATGLRPGTQMRAEVQAALYPVMQAPTALAELIDPEVRTCPSLSEHGEPELRHPAAGLSIAGIKSYGRAGTFLPRTGYRQVASNAAALAGQATGRHAEQQADAFGQR